ncbi:MAG: acyltransferase domain-containing protein, partial [Stackebrandtia sp.]
MPSLTEIRDRLGLPDSAAKWYEIWDSVGAAGTEVPVPEASEIEPLLRERFGADAIDAEAVAAARPDPDTDPELWWVIERCYGQLLADMGGPEMLLWPQMPEKWGVAGRFVHLYALLAAMPRVFEYNRGKGIHDDITWATLSNLAEKLRLNRARHGFVGLEVAHWFTLHFRGSLYQLGRLEFAPERVGPDRSIPGLGEDDLVLGVHIPQVGGPMTAAACAASIERAREFFPRHFGDRFA